MHTEYLSLLNLHQRMNWAGPAKCFDIIAPATSIQAPGRNGGLTTWSSLGNPSAAVHVAGVMAVILSEKSHWKANRLYYHLTRIATRNAIKGVPFLKQAFALMMRLYRYLYKIPFIIGYAHKKNYYHFESRLAIESTYKIRGTNESKVNSRCRVIDLLCRNIFGLIIVHENGISFLFYFWAIVKDYRMYLVITKRWR